MVSLDSADREESNGVRFVENGDELIELGAYFVNTQKLNGVTGHAVEPCNVPAVTIMGPDERRCNNEYSDQHRPRCRVGIAMVHAWDREIGSAVNEAERPPISSH